MTNEQWEEYFARLEGPEGCDFREAVPGKPDSVTWTCGGGYDKSKSRAILLAMGIDGEALEEVLGRVEDLGGHCDCEVLFNAAERILPDVFA